MSHRYETYLRPVLLVFCGSLALLSHSFAADAPKLVQKDGHYALMVDGRPYLILGGQIHNSSAWPIELPQVWESMAALHANTVEVPVYWEQLEPEQGRFNCANVDQIVEGARSHSLHVVLLWLGTWKNGNMHYAPAWVKSDTKRFPRVVRPDGEPIDVFSPLSRNTLEADKSAFVALMRHLKQIDTDLHTVLILQVVNESASIGSELTLSIDMIGPDITADDARFSRETMRTYRRVDNPLWIPETGRSDSFGKFFFYALGAGAIGFSPFGADQSGWNILGDEPWKAHARNFALIAPISREIAQLEFEGKLKTAVQEPGQSAQEVYFEKC